MTKGTFTAVIRPAPEGGWWATCPEMPGANGQGETVEEARENLKEAIRLILEDLQEEALKDLSDDVVLETIDIVEG